MTTNPTRGAADLPEALRPVEPVALIASIQELNAWEARADGELLTQAEGDSIILVLHELKRLLALAAGQATTAQQPGAAYAALPDADRDCMRKVVAVAVTMLFDGYKEDVTRVFSTGELSEFVTITAAMGGERVEDIYRRAWDLLSLPVHASHGQASSQAGEYPALVCDYCGALTPDPWHSSGMLHGKMSKHIHSCDACAGGETTGATDMTTRQPEALRQAAWLKMEGASCQRHYDLGVLIERQHAELETLRAKLKTHEDLGDAGSDVQLLRMGYAAARLEIESLRKEHADEPAVAYMCGASREKEIAAQQPGAAGLIGALKDAQQAINSMKVEAETAAQGDEQMMLEACETISNEGLQADTAIRVALASHRQAPAGATLPEGWVPLVITHEGQSPEEIAYGPQRMMDRLGKWLRKYFDSVVAAPTTQPAPPQEPSCTSVQLAEMVLSDCGHSSIYMPLLNRVAARIDAHVERCLESKKTAQQEAQSALFDEQGFREWVLLNLPYDTIIGNSAYWADLLSKGIQRFVKAAPQPSPAARGDALDAARYRLVRRGQHWSVIDGIGNALRAEELDAAVDAARAAQEGK